MNLTAEQIKTLEELTESYLDSLTELNILKKMIVNKLDGIDFDCVIECKNGGTLSYTKKQTPKKLNYVIYSAFLADELKKGKKYTQEELDEIKRKYISQKEAKRTLKITRN